MTTKAEKQLYQQVNRERKKKGFLSIEEVLALAATGNTILDPFSILISCEMAAQIGAGNVFYPNVILEAVNGGRIFVGDKNIFYPQTLILADQGSVTVGNENQFGDGGVSLKANQPDAEIIVGDRGRYLNGVQILGRSYLGSGSQVIGGLLTVQNCWLEGGETHHCQDCDLRAGVIKGFGLARDLKISQGKVISGQGIFRIEEIKDQSFYHPKAKT